MKRAIGWLTTPATGWALTAGLALAVLAGGHLMPQNAGAEPSRGWMPDHRIAPAQVPAVQASGQRLARPQKWVF